MSTLSIILASICCTAVVLSVGYDALAFYFGWSTISWALYQWDKSWAQLPRWIAAAIWMHVCYGEASYTAVSRYFGHMP